MTLLLSPVQDRLVAVLAQGRGASGTISPDATPRAIPSGYFRYTRAPLTDVGLSVSAFDRGLSLRWVASRDGIPPNSPLYSFEEQEFGVEVCVGYLVGDAQTPAVHKLTASESATDAVQLARMRALSDARMIERALGYYELTTGALDAAGTAIIDVFRAGDVRFEETVTSRLMCVQPFTVKVWVSNTAAYVVTP